MDRVEMGTMIGEFVVLDDGDASNEQEEGYQVECCVYTLSDSFLICCVRWLER